MNTRTNYRLFVATILAAYVLGGLLLGITPSYALPVHAHGESFTNDTGRTANDLHVDLPHPVRQPNGNSLLDFGSPTFAIVAVVPPSNMNLDWKGADATRSGTVAPNGSATIF
jgi:hypothetical protein